MSINCTTTAGHTFTDETIEDADLNAAAAPTVTIPDAAITEVEIDDNIQRPSTLNLTTTGTISWQCTPGAVFQPSYLSAYNPITMQLFNVEDGMFGWCACWAGAAGVDSLSVTCDTHTVIHNGAGESIELSPATQGARFVFEWFAGGGYVFVRVHGPLT